MSGARAKIRRGYVETRAGQVHYLERDGRAAPIVFLHQTASAAHTYEGVMKSPHLVHRVVALDTPGFGGSFDPPGWPTMRGYANVLREAIDGLGIDRFHLFGHHTGACLGAEMAMMWQDRVASLMMLGPVLMNEAEREQFRGAFQEPFRPVEDGSHLVKNWRYARANNPDCDPEIVHDEVVCMIRAWKGRAQAYSAVSYQDNAKVLSRVKAPILLLTSKTDYFHAEFGRALALRPDAAVATVQGGNFAPMLGGPSIAKAISKFLDSLSDS